MDAFVDVPGIGRVRITARRLKHKRGQSTLLLLDAGKRATAPT